MQKKIILNDRSIEYTLKKSARAKRMRITIGCDARVLITLPKSTNYIFAEKFLTEKFDWVFDRVNYFKKNKQTNHKIYTKKDYLKNKYLAAKIIGERINKLNVFYKYKFKNISIKNQKTRWGSCSKNKNLNFNYKIIFFPEEIMDYIIVHELCHLKEFNHSKSFWALVSETVPNFKELRKKLRKTVL